MPTWLQPVQRFTDEQKQIYDKILNRIRSNDKYSCIIKGPAGTGKTLILAQLALQVTGKRGMFLLYTNAFRNFIINALHDTGNQFTEMQTSVETFYKWLFSVYRTNIRLPYPDGEFEEKTDKMISKLLPVVKQNTFDLALIDEGQDFRPNVIQLIKKISRQVIFVGDVNQSIYEKHQDDLGDLLDIINPEEVHNLILSIRISPSILRFMRNYVFKIYPKLQTVKRNEERDSKPLIYHSINLNKFLNYFISNVAVDYLRSNKNLVVTCRHKTEVDSVYDKIKNIENGIKVYKITTERDQDIDFSENAIYCITMHSCKGLEFDNLLFLNINNDPTDCQKQYENLAYTVYTRAREDLIIYSPDNNTPLREYLDFGYAIVITELPTDDNKIDIETEYLI
ncbi:MAG: UvrD-helicase domain-containing protein [Bacteroidetes bacterium]|nr:UvrD-helicase domain-containing protein [Bacteroidota bacterium]